jgi:hypothetical protein
VAALALERPGKPREVARGRLPPPLAVGIALIDVDEQSRQRADVLIVVAHDVDERPRLAPAEVVEVAAGNLPAGDIRAPSQPEQLRLDRPEARVRHAVAEDPAHDRQQIEMARVPGRIRAGHPIPRHEEWPVEAPPVVRHQPASRRDPGGQLGEECRFVGVIREQELDLPESAALPPAQPDEERQCSRGGREPRGLRVEAEQGSVGGRLARERRESRPIDWKERARRLDPDE